MNRRELKTDPRHVVVGIVVIAFLWGCGVFFAPRHGYEKQTAVCQDRGYDEYVVFRDDGYCLMWEDGRLILAPYIRK